MNDYDRIARVIHYLDTHHTEQPDLAVLASHVGLSPFHFHRLFSNWAAITPKDFLQCLTLAHAKALLQQGNSVLDSALNAGLSGPGRLYDLCVNLETATPGEVKTGGAGWTISAGIADTPFGDCLLGESPRGICHLSFIDATDDTTEWAALQQRWPQAQLRRDDSVAAQLAGRIFNPTSDTQARSPLRAWVRGTTFQVHVWRALLQIQPGSLISYGQLATALGKPTAARAVGTAIGQNALAYLVPCHRVIRETGVVGDYRWGHVRKRAILAWESASQFNTEEQVSRYLDKDFMTSLSKIDSPTRRLIPFAPTGLRPPRLRITWLINSLATLRHGYHNASTATIAAAASSTHFAIAHTPNMQTALPIGD